MSEGAELLLSASSIKTYMDCGYRYLLEHVWRLPAAPNMDMAIGTAVHAGVEAAHKGARTPTAAVGVALSGEVVKMSEVPSADAQRASDEALAMYALYQQKIAPTFKPTMVERDFVIRVDGTLVSGRIDAADEDVHDTKTTANLSKFKPERHRFQMSVYRHGYRVLTGRWPGHLILDVIARNGRWKQVEIEPDDQEMTTAIALTRTGILDGRFEPTGASSGKCPRCPYATTGECAYARLD